MNKLREISFLKIIAGMWLLCLMITASPLSSAAAGTATVPVTVSGTCDYEQANMVVALTNSLRAELGLSPLVMDQQLTADAMQRAAECAFLFSHNHTRPDGSEWYTLDPSLLQGENIAAGNNLQNAVQVVNAWRDSEDHYTNIIDPAFQTIGVGCFKKGSCVYWVQSFSWSTVSSAPQSGIKTARFSVNVPLGTARSNMSLALPEATLEKGTSDSVRILYDSSQTYTPVVLENDQFLFTSLTPEVASVNTAGRVTALSAGNATIYITLKAAPAISFSMEYTVTDINGRQVTLDARGGKFSNGKSSRTFTVSNGSAYGTLPQPARKGYSFEGWFAKNGKRISASSKVSITKNTIKKLYAKWKKIKVGQASLSKASGKKGRQVKATARKVSGASGYQFYFSSSKKFKKKSRLVVQTSAKKRSVVIAYTLSGKYTYVKVRAYKLDSAGRAVYGKFSAVKKVKLR